MQQNNNNKFAVILIANKYNGFPFYSMILYISHFKIAQFSPWVHFKFNIVVKLIIFRTVDQV